MPAARLVPRDTPRIGRSHRVTVFDLPMDLAIMVFGWARTAPVPLGAYGAPGCAFEVSRDGAWLIAGQGHHGSTEFSIPDDVALVGTRFYHQAVVLDANAGNLLGAVVSDAAEGVIGHW